MSNATMKRTIVRFNYHDYLQLPEDKRYEILDGELFVVPAPNIRHQEISIRLSTILFQHVRRQKIGRVLEAPCDVVLSEENVVQPDILFVRTERVDIIGEMNILGAPDLVIEILLPATRGKDLEIKRKIYAGYGVQEYWVVDPEAAEVEVLAWSDSGYVSAGLYNASQCLSSPLLPELNLPLREIFAKQYGHG
jgi:Uma2 family endonuclease